MGLAAVFRVATGRRWLQKLGISCVASTPTRFTSSLKLQEQASCRGCDAAAALAVATVAKMMVSQRLTLIFCSVSVPEVRIRI